jgi:hypothetical protein
LENAQRHIAGNLIQENGAPLSTALAELAFIPREELPPIRGLASKIWVPSIGP